LLLVRRADGQHGLSQRFLGESRARRLRRQDKVVEGVEREREREEEEKKDDNDSDKEVCRSATVEAAVLLAAAALMRSNLLAPSRSFRRHTALAPRGRIHVRASPPPAGRALAGGDRPLPKTNPPALVAHPEAASREAWREPWGLLASAAIGLGVLGCPWPPCLRAARPLLLAVVRQDLSRARPTAGQRA